MRVLIMTSGAPDQSPFSTFEKRLPIGVGYVMGALVDAGCDVGFIDNYVSPHPMWDDYSLLRQMFSDVDMVGIYVNTVCFRHTLKMLYAIQNMRYLGHWQGTIMVGGPHVSVMPDSIPDFVDYVVIGEGEEVVCDIVAGNVKDRVIKGKRISDLDKLPQIPFDLMLQPGYQWDWDWSDVGPIFTLNTSRGCPHRCTFCSVGSIWGKRYTYQSGGRIVDDIERLVKDYKAQGIYFREDNFFCNPVRVNKFCAHLDTAHLHNLQWAAEARVTDIDEDLLQMCAHFGLKALYFGVESGSQRILDVLQKDINVEDIENAVALCKKYGVKVAASVMTGLPSETQQDREQTKALIQRLQPETVWWNVFCGLPNSELYQQMLADGDYRFMDDRGVIYPWQYDILAPKHYNNMWNYHSPRFHDVPKISVLMGVHNNADTIEEALKSIYNQTEQDFEIIMVDDGSTDDTCDVVTNFCRNYPKAQGRHVIKVPLPTQHGLAYALNVGLSFCRGQYVARMDGDDISLPTRFERQLKFLEANPDYGMVSTGYYLMKDGEIVGSVPVFEKDEDVRRELPMRNQFCHGGAMMRTNLIQDLRYDTSFSVAQDYELWSRMIQKTKMGNLPLPFEYVWRIHSQCVSIARQNEQEAMAQRVREQFVQMPVMGGDTPKVSVVIPTYNRPILLERAVRSVLNQYKVQDIEIIVVNDAGEDASFITGLDPRISYYSHLENCGLAAARNLGAMHAQGKYIAFLDDDDVLYRNHLLTTISYLESHPEHQLVYTDAYHATLAFEEDKGELVTKERKLCYSYDFDRFQLLVFNLFPVCCAVFHKSCFDKIGGFDPQFTTHEDWDFWIRMANEFEFHHIKLITCEVSMHPGTMTSTKGKDFFRTLQLIQQIYGEFATARPDIQQEMKARLEFDKEQLCQVS